MFFRTRQCTRVQKTCKIGEKMVCFWSYWQILERTCTQIKENVCKNAYLGSIVIPEKYVFRVCFESPFTRMISGLKYKCPPVLFQKVVFQKKKKKKKVFPKGQYSDICNFILTCDFFWCKNCSKQWWTFRISIYLHAIWRRAEQAAC